MSNCCPGFMSGCDTATITPNPKITCLECCEAQHHYWGVSGENYPFGMPVAFGADPGTVTPAPDGADAFGVVLSTTTSESGDTRVVVGHCGKRHACWTDWAPSVGQPPALDPAVWWPLHQSMLTSGAALFVEFV